MTSHADCGTTNTRFEVVCEDGVKRAPQTFMSRSEASLWAEWGHCCTNVHTINPVPARRLRGVK